MRILSAPAIEAVQAQETGEVMLVFLELELSPTFTLRVVNNWEEVTRGGNVYYPYRFEIGIPDEVDEGIPTVPLRIDNISSEILTSIMTLDAPIPVTMNVCLASSPNVVEAGPFSLKIIDVKWNDQDIEAELTFDDVMLEVYPGYRVTPSSHPAAF